MGIVVVAVVTIVTRLAIDVSHIYLGGFVIARLSICTLDWHNI
jgi:hypothetical protein